LTALRHGHTLPIVVLERDKGRVRLAAQTGREIGILVTVFAPLDALFQGVPPPEWQIMVLVFLGLTAIYVGINIESIEG
jgi:hypothetical protein